MTTERLLTCKDCGGQGEVTVSDGHYYGSLGCWQNDHVERCDACDGSGDARCDCGNVAAYAVDPRSSFPDFVCWECHLKHFLPCLPSDLEATP